MVYGVILPARVVLIYIIAHYNTNIIIGTASDSGITEDIHFLITSFQRFTRYITVMADAKTCKA